MINMHDVNLTGSVNVIQGEKATFANVTDATIIAAISKGLRFGDIADSAITLNTPLRRFSAKEFIASTPGSNFDRLVG